MASPSHDCHNFFRREIHDETKAYIWKIIVDLHLGFLMVPMAGFEPAPLILWKLCSTIKLHGQIQDAKEKIVGFEPTTFWLPVKHSTNWVKYFLNRKIAVCVFNLVAPVRFERRLLVMSQVSYHCSTSAWYSQRDLNPWLRLEGPTT